MKPIKPVAGLPPRQTGSTSADGQLLRLWLQRALQIHDENAQEIAKRLKELDDAISSGGGGGPEEPGKDGITPHIGANGNWWIGDTDTGRPSRGEPGYTPQRGVDYWTPDDVQSMIAQAINGVLEEKATILQAAYPIGAVYISVSAADPADLFGFGIWTRIQDAFLLAAGRKYAAGATGGEDTHTLTVAEIPSHTHAQLGAAGGAANSSPVRQAFQTDGNVVVYGSDGSVVWATYAMSNAAKTYRSTVINMDGVTGSTGSSAAHNNMPPYLAVYVWQRTA